MLKQNSFYLIKTFVLNQTTAGFSKLRVFATSKHNRIVKGLLLMLLCHKVCHNRCSAVQCSKGRAAEQNPAPHFLLPAPPPRHEHPVQPQGLTAGLSHPGLPQTQDLPGCPRHTAPKAGSQETHPNAERLWMAAGRGEAELPQLEMAERRLFPSPACSLHGHGLATRSALNRQGMDSPGIQNRQGWKKITNCHTIPTVPTKPRP